MRSLIGLLLLTSLGGCIAYTAASTAVSVTATAVETTVDAGAAVVGGAVDLVTPDDDDEDED